MQKSLAHTAHGNIVSITILLQYISSIRVTVAGPLNCKLKFAHSEPFSGQTPAIRSGPARAGAIRQRAIRAGTSKSAGARWENAADQPRPDATRNQRRVEA